MSPPARIPGPLSEHEGVLTSFQASSSEKSSLIAPAPQLDLKPSAPTSPPAPRPCSSFQDWHGALGTWDLDGRRCFLSLGGGPSTVVRGLGAERWPMGGRSEPGGGKEVKSLPLHSFPGLTWWRKSKTAVLLEVWNHRIARATRECCSCLLPSQPNIQSLGTSGGLCLLHPFSPHTAATPALSRPPSHGMTHNSQRVSLKTQVRSCHFSAQNRAGLLISFSVGAEVLTVALQWALPLPLTVGSPPPPALCLYPDSSGPPLVTAGASLPLPSKGTPPLELCPAVPGTHSFRSSLGSPS